MTKLLIFGITGDLSTRKLLPALKKIIATGDFDDLEIIGVSRREVDVNSLLTNSLGDFELAPRTRVITMNIAERSEYDRLREDLALQDDEQLLVYLSVPPSASTQIVNFLGEAGLNDQRVKILFEKPFGFDVGSAREMIERTSKHFSEYQLYRIDHYLAKEMAQNIVAFRSNNAILAHLWNNQSIEKIEVNAFEKIGIEGRAQFYEQTGALRDIVQGHLMQLLALVLMKIPADADWQKSPLCRANALHLVTLADPEQAVRAQYDTYREEVGVPTSTVETFVSLELSSNDEDWLGVPLRLTTGKALDVKRTEIKVHFKRFRDSQTNCLIFRIQPHEGIDIALSIKKPGYDHDFEEKHLLFEYPDDTVLPDAYEQVIVDAIRSKKSLFAGSDEVLRSWEILEPIQRSWSMDATDIQFYASGSDPYSLLNSVE